MSPVYATEVVYTGLLTALAASNNKPATCVIHTGAHGILCVRLCRVHWLVGPQARSGC